MFGKGLGNVWEMFGKCLGKVWERFGKGLGKVWKRETAFSVCFSGWKVWNLAGMSIFGKIRGNNR
jgi:hypothetical protein